MQALEIAISAKMPGSPASRTKCEVSLTSVSEIDARTNITRSAEVGVCCGSLRSASAGHHSGVGPRTGDGDTVPRMRVWIDLTNSPHVLVMRPVIELLLEDGHEVRVTARDFAQTLGLLRRFQIPHTA